MSLVQSEKKRSTTDRCHLTWKPKMALKIFILAGGPKKNLQRPVANLQRKIRPDTDWNGNLRTKAP